MENNEIIEEKQEAPKIEKVSLDDIELEKNEEFSEKVDVAFQNLIEAYQKLSPEERLQVKEYLKK